jgi:hypothetical protein
MIGRSDADLFPEQVARELREFDDEVMERGSSFEKRADHHHRQGLPASIAYESHSYLSNKFGLYALPIVLDTKAMFR